MNIKLIILIFVLGTSFQKDFMCSHIFEKDYIVFWLRNEAPVFKITNEDSSTIEWGCAEIDIPDVCGVKGKANFIYYAKNEPCLILQSDNLKFEKLNGKYDQKTLTVSMSMDGKDLNIQQTVSTKAQKQIKLSFNVWQDSGDVVQNEVIANHPGVALIQNPSKFIRSSSENSEVFTIELRPKKTSFFRLTFLQALKEHNVITMLIFFSFGLILCFFGLKFYKDMLMFFIPLIMVLLGFYLYMAIVEKSVDQNNKLMLILITLLCLGAFVALAVTFTNIIYIVLCKLISIRGQLPTRYYC